MKPRLKFCLGLWFCSLQSARTHGTGYTPVQAYDDWLYRMLQLPGDFGACGNVGMGGV